MSVVLVCCSEAKKVRVLSTGGGGRGIPTDCVKHYYQVYGLIDLTPPPS
jgi:hypothetical protein